MSIQSIKSRHCRYSGPTKNWFFDYKSINRNRQQEFWKTVSRL